MLDGLIVLDKPAGLTSARAVSAVKRSLPPGTKLGHAGALDPFATGVLLLLVGKATRSCEQVMSWRKTYEATVKFGATTATDDPEAPEEPFAAPSLVAPSKQRIEEAVRAFVGPIEQRPPVYSAIKIGGRRACDRVRAGDEVVMKPRVVHVHAIDVLDYDWPLLKLRIECGRGTYIRSIARDLGMALGVGGYLTALRRTRIGACDVDRAARIEQLTPENVAAFVRPL